jgi:hypothetical protein
MNTDEIIRQIDAEIQRLTEARDVVAGTVRQTAGRNRRKAGGATPNPRAAGQRRTISAEGRAKIAAAQKRRWAKQKRAK